MRFTPYLSFDGRCAEAFAFYEQLFGGGIAMIMKWGESPIADQVPPEWGGKVMHATLEVDGAQLAGADDPPASYRKPQGFWVTLDIGEPAEAERIFAGLAEGGEVRMPLAETFWARRFGMAVDRFGTPWMINCGGQQ